MSPNDEDLEEKKLLGSGGYAIARLTEAEEMKVNLGVHHLFLGNKGRLAEDRFLRYYCNKCEIPNWWKIILHFLPHIFIKWCLTCTNSWRPLNHS